MASARTYQSYTATISFLHSILLDVEVETYSPLVTRMGLFGFPRLSGPAAYGKAGVYCCFVFRETSTSMT